MAYRQWNGEYCRALDNSEYTELSEYMLNLIGVWEPVTDYSKESYQTMSERMKSLKRHYVNMSHNERISNQGRLIIKQIKDIGIELRGINTLISVKPPLKVSDIFDVDAWKGVNIAAKQVLNTLKTIQLTK